MTKDLKGKRALVTGASSGLGDAFARKLAAAGADIVVAARRADRLASLAKDLSSVKVDVIANDLSEPGAAKELHEKAGKIDILVNNAALALGTRFEKISAEEWRRALEVNMTVPFLLTQAVVPAMRRQQYGRVVNISSTAGRQVSTLGGAHYTASKAGLLGLTRASAKELGSYGITVNAVCPGMIDTELTREHASPDLLQRLAAAYPVPRLGQPVEVADLVCFIASEAAGYITGASFDINGGDLMI